MGLLVILYVSVEMIYEGYREVRYGREAAHAEEVLESTDSELRQENETKAADDMVGGLGTSRRPSRSEGQDPFEGLTTEA